MYEIGVFVALAIVLIRFIYAFLKLNSKLSKNLELIGRRLSYFSLEAKAITLSYRNQGIVLKILKFLIIWLFLPLILIFLSWLYVVYLIGIHLYQLIQTLGVPNDIKEYRWKINNLDLSFDQMVELTYKLVNHGDMTLEQFKNSINESLMVS